MELHMPYRHWAAPHTDKATSTNACMSLPVMSLFLQQTRAGIGRRGFGCLRTVGPYPKTYDFRVRSHFHNICTKIHSKSADFATEQSQILYRNYAKCERTLNEQLASEWHCLQPCKVFLDS